VRSCLIDSGPLIALFAVDDHHHARFDTIVKELSAGGLRLITTWPCIIEASYLLEIPQRFEMLKWIELGGAVVYPIEPDIDSRGRGLFTLSPATRQGFYSAVTAG
jgi:hypothetical protein